MPKITIEHLNSFLVFLVVYVFSFALLSYSTQIHGISICVDCKNYLEGAQSIIAGNGYSNCNGVFINHFPPLYSLQLAVASILTNKSPEDLGIIFNSFYLSVFIFFTFLVLKLTTKSNLISSIGIIILITSPIIFLFSFFLSEVPFLGLMMVYFFTILKKSNAHEKYFWVGILISLLILTRFAGIVFLGISFIQILSNRILTCKEKTNRAILLISPVILVFIIWKTYTINFQSSDISTRSIIYHPVSSIHWRELYLSIKSIFFNNTFSFSSLCVLIFLSIISLMKREFYILFKLQSPAGFLLISAIIYLIFILFAISFFDFAIVLEIRIIAPFVILFIIALISILYKSLSNYNNIFSSLFFMLCMVYLIGNIKKNYIFLEKYRFEGAGFNSNNFDCIKIPEHIKNTTRFIYSDQYTLLKYKLPNLCDKILPLPQEYVEINNNSNTNFKSSLNQIITLIEKDSAFIVILNSDSPEIQKRNQKIIDLVISSKKSSKNSNNELTWLE